MSVHDVTSEISLHDSNYIIYVVIWPKFGNSSICMKELIRFSLDFIEIWPEEPFFEGCSWLELNHLRLALDMALKFYTSVEKGLILKVR